jgi:hypothetical protein
MPHTHFGFIDGKQSIEFLDNTNLILWWNSYYFWVHGMPHTHFGFIDGKQSIEFLDNTNLILWRKGHMYHNEVDQLKIRKAFKFAGFPVDITQFLDHPFA